MPSLLLPKYGSWAAKNVFHRGPFRPADRAHRHCLVRAAREEDLSAPDPSLQNKLNIPPEALQYVAGGWSGQACTLPTDMLASVADLPMTESIVDYQTRALGLRQWKAALQKGMLPRKSATDFPVEPFRKKFIESMSTIEMPRFTRRYPALADAVLRQMLEYAHEFEVELLNKMKEQQLKAQQKQRDQKQQMQQKQQAGDTQEEGDCNNQCQGDGKGDENNDGEGKGQQSIQEQLDSGKQGSQGNQEFEVSLESQDCKGGSPGRGDEEKEEEEDGKGAGGNEDELSKAAEELAEDMAQKFEDEMSPIVENIENAMEHFGGALEELLDGKKGWDLSQGTWRKTGWQEFKKLRKKLENLRELRELVRNLGRGGGKGPLRRAPEEVYSARKPPGVIRSALVPEQVQGLYRSGSLTQMLPGEAALMAVGWPRGRGSEEYSGATGDVAVAPGAVDSGSDGSSTAEEEVEARGSHPARMLFKARLAEKALLSYERAGWLEEPAKVTRRMEMRPAGELGPIIACLDTSASMSGGREIVAKALVLECMRGAKTQSRKCFVYAFSGPSQVKELDLSEPGTALPKLLSFLEHSFSGGTDVDRPLELALKRLKSEGWDAADILMVTDGEIPRANKRLINGLKKAQEDLGLEVHGLLVGNDVSDAMEEICTHTHLFKGWSAVGVSGTYGW